MAFREFSIENLAGKTPPARTYLWLVFITPISSSGPSDLLTAYARKCGIPSLDMGEQTITYMNSRFYIATRKDWSTTDVTFLDNEKGEIYGMFYRWHLRMYNVEGAGEGAVPKEYKSRMDIHRLTVKGDTIDEFQFYGVWPKTVSALDMDYEADGATTFSVTFRYDFFLRNPNQDTFYEGFPSSDLSVPGIGF